MAIADYLRKLVELKNQLVVNLKSMGVAADESEKLNTLVPKVLECGTGTQNVEAEFDASTGAITSMHIDIPNSVEAIGDRAYTNVIYITSVSIPDSVTSLGQYAFSSCSNLKSINIPEIVTSIGTGAFYKCTSLESIVIPGIDTVPVFMCQECTNLKTVKLCDGISILGDGANYGPFYKCTNLESVIMPSSITIIGYRAFQNCNNLAHIYYAGTQTQWEAITKYNYWNSNMGSNVSGGTKIHYNYIDTPYNVYGVIWDGSSSTKLTRTNDSEKFSDPVPALGGTGGSSPFDSCYPWSEIERVTIDGNELVKIPKFWYRIVKHNNELSFQIADGPVEGFNVSPAHADRGDGKGERDYVYIGRYQCTSSNYKSVTNTAVMTNITRATARSSITSLGSGYYMKDFALYWTIRMLYLVEFADWDSQKVIGYGCGDGVGPVNTGTTDNMSYHTGTMHSARTTYGTGIQYRWIEDPWANAYDWCDGIRFSGSDIYVFNNPSEYSDTTGGIKIGTRPTTSGYITQWSVPSVSGYDWALYPSTVSGGSGSTYVADVCFYVSSGVELCVGGSYGQRDMYGAFFLNGNCTESESWGDIGARLQYLP